MTAAAPVLLDGYRAACGIVYLYPTTGHTGHNNRRGRWMGGGYMNSHSECAYPAKGSLLLRTAQHTHTIVVVRHYARDTRAQPCSSVDNCAC